MRTLVLALTLAAAAALRADAPRTVSSPAELEAALKSAQPGDTLLLKSGTWRDAALNLTRGGADGAPITLRAEEPGRVVLAGASSLTFSAPFVVVDGLRFTQGALKRGSVVTFHAAHCRLTNSAIVDFNPADVATPYYWVYFKGSDNRLDHCYFKGKSHQQPLVGNDTSGSRHNTTDHCYFKDIPYVPDRNGREIFRIWGHGRNEELEEDGAFFTIEDNLFDHANGEGMEIISLKSNRNVVRRNTIRQSRGGITLRAGNYNTVEENLILCDGAAGAYGMRVTGQHHRIVNNRIERGAYGIHLMAGDYIEQPLTPDYRPILRPGTPLGRVPAYSQPRGVLVAHNTLVDNQGPDLLLGAGYKSGWPHAQRVLMPEDNRIEDNLIRRTGGVAVAAARLDPAPPLDRLKFGPNLFSGNAVLGGEIRLAPLPEGIAALPASARPDFRAGVSVELHALGPDDVGPEWVRARRKAGEPF